MTGNLDFEGNAIDPDQDDWKWVEDTAVTCPGCEYLDMHHVHLPS